MDEQALGDQLEPIYNSFVLIQDLAWKTCRERWTIGKMAKERLLKTLLAARHDDNDFTWE